MSPTDCCADSRACLRPKHPGLIARHLRYFAEVYLWIPLLWLLMVVVLAADKHKRHAIFRAYNVPIEEAGFDPLMDIGQGHIFITGD